MLSAVPVRPWLVGSCLLLALGATPACRPAPHPPPYPGGQAPRIEALLAAAAPALPAIAVPRARIKLGVHRGHLAFLAQSPDRFRGSVTIAGNEMVSLSLHEAGYHLVNKLDGIPTGYYEGPPAACAVAALLGVGLDGPRLVRVVLGGAPMISDFNVTDHGWDRARTRERITLENGQYRQELLFRHDAGTWRFAAATLWRHTGERLWTVEHTKWHTVDGLKLPRLTRLSRPGQRRDQVVTIEVKQVNTQPPWAKPATTEPTDPDAGESGDAGDDGGWENEDDSGWENDDPQPRASEPAPAPTAKPEPAPKPPPAVEPAGPPAIWKLAPGSLPHRGDLCKGKSRGRN